jgi:hypothetical protein
MDAVMEHLQMWYPAYIVGGILLLPVIFFTRHYSLPAILFAIEMVIYMFIAHVVIWCIVNVATWFKNNSSMKALDKEGVPEGAVDWTTPLLEFWKIEEYNPGWIVYMEGVFAVLIVIAVLRYRPLKVHNPHKRRYDDGGKLITGKSKGSYQYKRPGAGATRGRH